MDGDLCDMVLPRRKSATQASRAFADQLDSSDGDSQPGGSDAETKKKKKVPNKGTNKSGRLQTYGKRGRPLKAAPLTTTNTLAVPAKLELESPEGGPSPRAPKPKPKAKQIVKRKRSPSLSILSSTPMKQAGISAPVGAVEPANQTNPSDNEIILLSTNFPERVRKRAKGLLSQDDVPSSRPQKDNLSVISHSVGLGSSDSEIEILSFTPAALPPSGSTATTSPKAASSHGSRHRVEPAWTSQNLGCYVWVLIEPTTCRVVDPNKDQSQDEYRMWWPGKVS
jgi:hypothetical protein